MTASMGIEGFLDLFGKPDRETACECERKTEMSLPQALSLLNGSVIADAVADPEGRVANLVLSGRDNEELIAELYLATLSRYPPPTMNPRSPKVTSRPPAAALPPPRT